MFLHIPSAICPDRGPTIPKPTLQSTPLCHTWGFERAQRKGSIISQQRCASPLNVGDAETASQGGEYPVPDSPPYHVRRITKSFTFRETTVQTHSLLRRALFESADSTSFIATSASQLCSCRGVPEKKPSVHCRARLPAWPSTTCPQHPLRRVECNLHAPYLSTLFHGNQLRSCDPKGTCVPQQTPLSDDDTAGRLARTPTVGDNERRCEC